MTAPLFRQIADELRAAITSGRLRPGEQIPSENELAERHRTTRVTVRKALALLRGEGLIVSEQGRGAFVRPQPRVQMLTTGSNWRRRRDEGGAANFNAEAQAQGRSAEQQLLGVGRIPAPADIAERLGVEPGTEVLARRLRMMVDGMPMQLVTAFFVASRVVGTPIEEARRIRGGVARVLEDPDGPIGVRIAQFVEELEARMPTPEEREALAIPLGVPLVQAFRSAYTDAGEVIEVLDCRIPGDRHRWRYVIDVP